MPAIPALRLTGAAPLLTAFGVGQRRTPDPAAVTWPPLPVSRLDAADPAVAAMTPLERRLAHFPLRGARLGPLRWGGTTVKQTSPQTCGPTCLLLLAAAGDPVVAAWLTSGRRIGAAPPPELARLRRSDLAAPDVAGRLAAAERAVHATLAQSALGPAPWPTWLGTPPWALARAARFRGVTYAHTPVDDRDIARTRAVLESVSAATRRGTPVPLYTGGNLRGGAAAALPRHVVLALPYGGRPDALRIYEPGRGRIYEVGTETLLGRQRPHAALGGWTHLVWAVLPDSAWPA